MAQPPRKILVIRLSSLGDVLLTSPALSSLHAAWPGSEIHFLTRKPMLPLIQFHPAVSKTWVYPAGKKELARLKKDLRSEQFDLVADWQGNFRSFPFRRLGKESVSFKKYRFRRWLYLKFNRPFTPSPVPVRYLETLAPYEVPDSGAPVSWVLPEPTRQEMTRRFLAWKTTDGPVYFVAAGARHETKRYPATYFIQIMKMLAELQPAARFILLGGPDELETASRIKKEFSSDDRVWNAAGGFSLAESAVILKNCDGGLTNDSFLMHAATAFQVPVVAFFGGTTPQLGFAPFRSPALIAEDETVSCRPCSHIGRESCPKGHFDCMNRLNPEAWFPKIYHFLISEQVKP